MKAPAEFEDVFQDVELTEREIGFLVWVAGWDSYTITNLQSVIQKVRAKAIDDVIQPSNEPPPCYQPDGDGCVYQCYDGDDEPIDKCKECPLCYSDKQRYHTPPNEPLTMEEVAKAYLEICGDDCSGDSSVGIPSCPFFRAPDIDENGMQIVSGCKLAAYRRPPEVSP